MSAKFLRAYTISSVYCCSNIDDACIDRRRGKTNLELDECLSNVPTVFIAQSGSMILRNKLLDKIRRASLKVIW
jgi:hypothetical protein